MCNKCGTNGESYSNAKPAQCPCAKVPHKHAALIKQWADGAEIEIFSQARDKWMPIVDPTWTSGCQYRIKPVPHKWQHVIDAHKAGDPCQIKVLGSWCDMVHTHVWKWNESLEYRIKPDPISKSAALAALEVAVQDGTAVAYNTVKRFIEEQE